jgi:uncharacterized repeat protein (TIGR03803 family)
MRGKRLSIVVTYLVAIFTLTMLVTNANAQTFTTLHSFDGTDGRFPEEGMVQATNGNLYGMTEGDGANGDGTVFKITPSGTLTTLHSFDGTDGAGPPGGPIQATDGNFYGTKYLGGANDSGTVFKMTPGGKLTTLYSFCSQSNCSDGFSPSAPLVQATNGDLYGTTESPFAGTVFKITLSGKLTTLHTFDTKDGFNPNGLIQATDGNLYGTTLMGGASGSGTVFKMTLSGKLTTLQSFGGIEGEYCGAGLVQASDGNFYGTVEQGGANGDGTVFKITPSGKLTTLHSFHGADGENPSAGLIQATDGNLYGTTLNGGTNGDGTVFKITLSGKLTTLHNFDGADGSETFAGLVQATDGNLYGAPEEGGANGDGTVFKLSVGLGPFVETQPTSGTVGAAVKILGTNLTGATSVTFDGTAAVFKVVSKSLITTSVPTGATTGKVEVKTPRGPLKSNVVFRVTK